MKIRICAITPAVVLLRYISNKDELRPKPTSLLYLVVVKNLENDQFDIQLYFDRNRLIWKKVLDGFYKGQYDLKTLNYM